MSVTKVTQEESEEICSKCPGGPGQEECVGCFCKTCTPECPNKECDSGCHG